MQPPLAESEPFLSRENSTNNIEECTYVSPSPSHSKKEETATPTHKTETHKMASSDIIGDILGPCGKWQLKAIILIYLTKIPSSWFMACVIFTAPAPYHGEFYCEPSNQSHIVGPHNKVEWIQVAHPLVEDPHDKEFKFDYCNVYENAHLRVNESTRMNETMNVVPCDKFTYHPDYRSVVTQFDLVCSRDVLVAVTQFFHLFGVLLGGIIATKLMDL